MGWPRSLIPGLWLWSSSGEQRAALGCRARNLQRGFPSASPPNLLLLCSLARRNKSPGSPCPPSSCGVMWAATSWAVLCQSPAMGLQQGEGGSDEQNIRVDFLGFFACTESYCWNVHSRCCQAECLGKLVLRLVLTGLSAIAGSVHMEGSDGVCMDQQPQCPALSVSAVHINLVYYNSKSSLLSSLTFPEQTCLSPLYFVIRF